MSSSSQTPEPSYRVAARFFVSGLPIALVDGAKLTVTALTVMQIGHAASSATPLAAATLGVLTFNVAGNMILTAPLSAMDTIAPQAFGAVGQGGAFTALGPAAKAGQCGCRRCAPRRTGHGARQTRP